MDASSSLSDWPPFAELLRHPLEADGTDSSNLRVGVMSVTGNYFSTLGMRVIDGRPF